MSCKEQLSLSFILNSIKHILKQYSLRENNTNNCLPQQISSLTQQLQATSLNSQNILKMMVDSESSQHRIKTMIWNSLRQCREQQFICKQYNRLKRDLKQNYTISNSNTNILIKDILENIKLIEEELVHLQHNITDITQQDSTHKNQDKVRSFSLYLLLKIAMDDTQVQFSQRMNQLLFRMYILEESITLILVKTQRTFYDITNTLLAENISRRSSFNSEKNSKKSALSQSIQIYKRKQLQQQIQKTQLLNQVRRQKQIQLDYQMIRKLEKKASKADNYAACCFRF